MEYFWWLYLATRLDAINTMFGFMIALSIFLSVIIWVDSDVYSKKSKPYRWSLIILFAFSVIGATLTPSKNDAMFIAGGIGVIEASKAIAGSDIAKKSVGVIEQWLTNEVENLKNKKNNR